jgi:hypothetical protein
MKVRLTESQYKRLLKEDDKDFLNGGVNFKTIGNKVNLAIAKLFIMMQREGKFKISLDYLKVGDPIYSSQSFRDVVKYIILMLSLENSEAILLAHNYISFLRDKIVIATEKNDPNLLVGEPLQFFGKYKYPISYFWSGYVNGSTSGDLECYATDDDDFTKKIDDGFYDVIANTGEYVEYEISDLEWEPNDVYTFDSIVLEDIDLDEITIDI